MTLQCHSQFAFDYLQQFGHLKANELTLPAEFSLHTVTNWLAILNDEKTVYNFQVKELKELESFAHYMGSVHAEIVIKNHIKWQEQYSSILSQKSSFFMGMGIQKPQEPNVENQRNFGK